MDFVSYLNAESLEIYQLVSQKTAVAENSPACKKTRYIWLLQQCTQ